MDLILHGSPSGRNRNVPTKSTHSTVASSLLHSTPDAPRKGGHFKPVSSDITMNTQGYGDKMSGVHGQLTFDSKVLYPRPDCVPALQLGTLNHTDNILRNPVTEPDDKYLPPDTASTVSWGYHDHNPPSMRETVNRPPFALHHAPEMSHRISQRSQHSSHHSPKPDCVPNLQLHQDSNPKPAWEESAPSHKAPPPASHRNRHHLHHNRSDFIYGTHAAQSSQDEDDMDLSPSSLTLQKKIEAERLAEDRKRHQIIDTMLVDQLSRAAISDPEQNQLSTDEQSHGLFQKPPMKNLHRTKVRTSSSATEELLAQRLSFSGRVVTRAGHDAMRELYGFYFALNNTMTVYEYRQFGSKTSALPFIKRGSYCRASGRRKGRPFTIQDISVGSDMSFLTSEQPSLPPTIAKQSVVIIRITQVDNAAKEKLLFGSSVPYNASEHSKGVNPVLTNQEIADMNMMSQIQGVIRNKIKKRASKTLTGLGRCFKQIDKSGEGKLSKEELLQALNAYHIEVDKKSFDSLWLILDQNDDNAVNYSEFRRAFFGEMNESRKSYVLKAFHKVDANKSGTMTLDEVRKFFNASKHPRVVQGKMDVEDIQEPFLELFENKRHEISYGDFEDFCEGLSMTVANDEEFVNIMKGCWNLS